MSMPVLFALAAGAALSTPPAVPPSPSPEILVLASPLRGVAVDALPASVTVFDGEAIRGQTLQHFEELTLFTPNLNWSGEGSRARYFQLRGSGELEQYEGAPNPSVGFIVDDIDLSGIGAVAGTFDVDRIEVLRGPQGTRYGADALAGLVWMRSTDPVATPSLYTEASAGSDDTRAIGVAGGGAVPGFDDLAGRLAVRHYGSNGFRRNDYLGRDDTNERDELTLRGKLAWQPQADTRVLLTALHLEMDNGYDAFATDNGYTTHSDAPGRDDQRTRALALRVETPLGPRASLVSISTLADTDSRLGFDADWGNAEGFAPLIYDFTQGFARERDTLSQELRLLSTPAGRIGTADWLLGVYLMRLDEQGRRDDRGHCDTATCGFDLAIDSTLQHDYDATRVALFGELSLPLGARTTLSAGLRHETRDAGYRDAGIDRIAATTSANRLDADDRMLGGELALQHAPAAGRQLWLRLARGYRGGGFNPSLAGFDFDAFPDFNVGADDIAYDTEYLWNAETGLRWFAADGRFEFAASLFWQSRDDMQVKIPVQLRAGDPLTYIFYTANAGSARTHGAEFEWRQRVGDALAVGAHLGLLRTRIRRFAARPELEGADFAHAPEHSFGLWGEWQGPAGWYLRASLAGRDRYVIDYCQSIGDCRDPRTSAVALADLRGGRRWQGWQVELWVRNLSDEKHAVRGFYFGNEPPDFTPTLYTRLGDPRHAGVTVSRHW